MGELCLYGRVINHDAGATEGIMLEPALPGTPAGGHSSQVHHLLTWIER